VFVGEPRRKHRLAGSGFSGDEHDPACGVLEQSPETLLEPWPADHVRRGEHRPEDVIVKQVAVRPHGRSILRVP
jgi:hypothetical protein